jgi:hypothetical protein
MALIGKFEERPLEPRNVHKSVECGYRIGEVDGQQILQLETYGTLERKLLDKVSQVIQLDEDAARELKRIIERAFPRA